MLLQLFSLYFESLILTTILVLIFLGIWIGLRAMSGVDKTAKARQAHLYDMIMIGVVGCSSIILCGYEFNSCFQGIILA